MQKETRSEDTLKLLRKIVDHENLVENRNKIIPLFTSIANQFTSNAASLLIHAIDRLSKQKLDPEPEICCLFRKLSADENSVSLKDVLERQLPAKYAKLQYYLRVYALRAISADRSATVDTCLLQNLVKENDLGRVAVIDYIITREKPPINETVGFLKQVVSCIENTASIDANSKRGRAIKRALETYNDTMRPPKFNLEELCSARQIMDNREELTRCKPEILLNWLQKLKIRTAEFDDTRKRALSHALTNFASSFKDHEILVDILECAIDIENRLDRPSPKVFSKVWRYALSLARFPRPKYEPLVTGLKLCFECLNLKEEVGSLSETVMEKFAGIASALHQIVDWEPLCEAVVGAHFENSCTQQRIVQLLITAIGLSNFPPKLESVTSLMRFGKAFAPTIRLELEHSYTSTYGHCFDRDWIVGISESNGCTPEEQNIAIAVLAHDCYRSEPVLAYNLCERLHRGDQHPVVRGVLRTCGFVDISQRLGIQEPRPEDMDIHQLMASLESAQRRSNPVEIIYALLNMWYNLYKHGCHQDATIYLRAALVTAEEALGSASVYSIGIRRIYKDFTASISYGEEETAIFDSAAGDSSCDYPFNEAVDRFTQPWIESLKTQSKFNTEYSNLITDLRYDILWYSIVSDSVLAYPPMVKASKQGSKLFEREHQIQVQQTYKSLSDSSLQDTVWSDKLKIAQKLAWLQIIDAHISEGDTSSLLEQEVPSINSIQNASHQACRSFYTGEAHHNHLESDIFSMLPEHIKYVCLNFEDDDNLLIQRIERGEVLAMVRVPLRRPLADSKDPIDPPDYEDFISDIEGIVQRSAAVSTDDRQEFWNAQLSMDKELKTLLHSIQAACIGGLIGLFTLPIGSLTCDPQEVKRVKYVMSSVLEIRQGRNDWSIHPTYVALLRLAILRNQRSEIEDILTAIFAAMKTQTLSVDLRDINMSALICELKKIFHALSASSSDMTAKEPLMLICDRKASRIPWESLPGLRECGSPITRALSLQQVVEWFSVSKTQEVENNCSFLVNPGNDLPQSHQVFVQDFEKRGWQGIAGRPPTTTEIGELMSEKSSFVYVGHGSGKNYMRGSDLRKLCLSRPAVFLLGCNSVRQKHWLLDDDALTDFAVMGCTKIMGTLWSVKDKDFNRFSVEFLSRVFDDEQSIGSALLESRSACVLPFLTGAAPVVYGLP